MKLKKLWLIIDAIKDVSGYTWDDVKGVNVTPASEGTWDAYVARIQRQHNSATKAGPFMISWHP
jgi:hypothetical protein